MQRNDAISPILDTVTQTLGDGHRIFYIGYLPEKLPSEPPAAWFARRASEHNLPAAAEIWRYELNYTLHDLAKSVTPISIDLKDPVSSDEDPELIVFEGLRSAR